MSICRGKMAYTELKPEAQKKKARRSDNEIIEALYTAIPTESVATISSLADDIDCTWRTVEKWLTLIWRIQRAPRISALRYKGGKRIVWQRERGSIPNEPGGS